MRRSTLYIGFLITITLMSIWCVAAWYLSRSYYLSRLNEQVQDITKLSQIRAEDLADSIKRNLNYQRGIPDFFIHAVRVKKTLLHNGTSVSPSSLPYATRKKRWIADPVFNDLDRTLAIASANFHVDLIHVVNAAGDSIAGSNWDTPTSTIGSDYSERDYFRNAKNGQRSVQYAVGKTTHIAGLFFCSPVFIKGKFMGAVVSKINIPDLTFLIRQTDAFVTDSNGVIILTHDQDKEMFSVPGSRVGKLPSSERESLYLRDDVPELQMKPWGDKDFASLLRIQGENYPQVIASKLLAEYGLTIYVEGELPTYFDLKRDQKVMFVLLSTLGGLFGVAALGGLNYVRSISRANERLGKSELRYKTLEAATFEGIIITSEGRIVDANDQLTQILGYERRELIGLSTIDIIAPEDIDRVMSNIQNGVESNIEHEMLRKDRSRIVVDAHGQTIEHDGVSMRLTAIREITERKRAEEELSRYRQHLEELVQTRTEQLNAALIAAESASRSKSEFLSSMSHELRTPLNAILGYAQLFSMSPDLSADIKEQARDIEDAGRHLLALINDMIDLSRIEAGRMELSMEPVSVRGVTADSVAMVASLAGTHGIELLDADCAGREDLVVHADNIRLRQVLINLLSNAIKYNRPHGSVRLACQARDGRVRISVADTGLGIAADKQSRIFNSFDRLGRETGTVEGTGIGLVITKRIVEAMGGSIGFESTAGQGSMFWVELNSSN